MMTARQQKFREKYVSEISPWYDGLVHIGIMYGAGIAAIWWSVSRMQDATGERLLVIPGAMGGNFFEWGIHKFEMQRLCSCFAGPSIYYSQKRQHTRDF